MLEQFRRTAKMQNTEKLCLQWNDFKENINEAFRELRCDTEFADVTLACEDGQQIEAHKLVLASSSPFFGKLLKKNKHPHPLVFMKGFKFDDLSAIVDFLYAGEANVFQENLDNFLTHAEELQLKGLTGTAKVNECDEYNDVSQQTKKQPSLKKEFFSPSENQNVTIRKPSPIFTKTVATIDQKVNVEPKELDDQIESMMSCTEKKDRFGITLMMCNLCFKELTKSHLKEHIESNHLEGVSHSCDICGKTARTRHALRQHKRSHKL